jgi:hypothetical protein
MIALAGLQIAINIIFQSKYGIWGAAVSFGVSMVIAAIGSTLFIRLLYAQERGLVKSILTPALGAFCSSLVLFGDMFEDEEITILVSLCVYFCVVVLTRKFLPGGPRRIQLSI